MISSRTACALAALLGIVSAGNANACSYSGNRWYIGSDSQARMTLRNSESCSHDFRLYGPISLTRLSVTQRPAHGVAGRSGRSSFAYKPASGYVGSDRFVVRIDGENAGQSGSTNIVVDVTVTN